MKKQNGQRLLYGKALGGARLARKRVRIRGELKGRPGEYGWFWRDAYILSGVPGLGLVRLEGGSITQWTVTHLRSGRAVHPDRALRTAGPSAARRLLEAIGPLADWCRSAAELEAVQGLQGAVERAVRGIVPAAGPGGAA